MNNITYLYLFCVLFTGCDDEINIPEDDYFIGTLESYYGDGAGVFELYYPVINYSEEAFIEVQPEEERFIYFECVNSTLRFNNTMIWCEKPKEAKRR